ncbi:hypothetical protein FOA52_007668 [Chlamydomonas sp. UWO 241]|nr:hypothetical protein FOA52_007668 [Chlamydomonas sp. UWO 241]
MLLLLLTPLLALLLTLLLPLPPSLLLRKLAPHRQVVSRAPMTTALRASSSGEGAVLNGAAAPAAPAAADVHAELREAKARIAALTQRVAVVGKLQAGMIAVDASVAQLQARLASVAPSEEEAAAEKEVLECIRFLESALEERGMAAKQARRLESSAAEVEALERSLAEAKKTREQLSEEAGAAAVELAETREALSRIEGRSERGAVSDKGKKVSPEVR